MRKTLLTLLCAATVVTATVARADILVSGKTITIKDNADPTKKKGLFLSKDAGFQVGALSPDVTGAFLTLANPVTFESSTSWYMPPLSWTAKNGSFTYKDKLLGNGPVQTAVLKNGLIKVVFKGGGMDYGLFNWPAQGTVKATLYIGATPICARFPGATGKVAKDDPVKGVFSAKNSEAPASCN